MTDTDQADLAYLYLAELRPIDLALAGGWPEAIDLLHRLGRAYEDNSQT